MPVRAETEQRPQPEGMPLHMAIAHELGLGDEVSAFESHLASTGGPRLPSKITRERIVERGVMDTNDLVGQTVVGGYNMQFKPVVRTRGGAFINIPEQYDPSFFTVAKGNIYANRVLYASVGNMVFVNQLSEPVRLDAIISSYAQDIPLGLPELSSGTQEDVIDNKIETLRVLEEAGIKTPNRLAFLEEDEARTAIKIGGPMFDLLLKLCEEKKETDRIVIKSNKGSLGSGVVIVSKLDLLRITHAYRDYKNEEDPARKQMLLVQAVIDMERFFEKMKVEGGLIIEDEVKSREIDGYNDNHRWNIRAYLAGDETIGMYARVGDARYPVNIKYKEPRSSRLRGMGRPVELASKPRIRTVARKLEDIGGLTEDEAGKVADVLSKIKKHLPGGIRGVDIMIDERGEPVVLEVNGFNSGGIGTLTMLYGEDSPHASRAVEALANQVKAGKAQEHVISEAVKSDFVAEYLFGRYKQALECLHAAPTAKTWVGQYAALLKAESMVNMLIDIFEAHSLNPKKLSIIHETKAEIERGLLTYQQFGVAS